MQKKSGRYLLLYSPSSCTRREVAPGCAFETRILEEAEVVGGSAMLPFERAMVVSIGCDHSAAIYHRMPAALKLTGVVHFGVKFGDEGVDRCKLNFNAIRERHGAVVCKIKSANIFCRLTTMQGGLHTSRSHVCDTEDDTLQCVTIIYDRGQCELKHDTRLCDLCHTSSRFIAERSEN